MTSLLKWLWCIVFGHSFPAYFVDWSPSWPVTDWKIESIGACKVCGKKGDNEVVQ